MRLTNLLWFTFFVATALVPNAAIAQPLDDDELEFQDAIENLAEDSEAEFDYDTYLEELRHYYESPIDLNKTDAEDLADLQILSEQQTVALLDHIDKYGKLANIYELQTIPGFDLPLIRKLVPFVRVRGEIDDFAVPFMKRLYDGDYQIFIRYQQILEQQAGYQDDNELGIPAVYLGNPSKLYARYRYNYGTRVSYGLTAEKDQGEEFFKGTQKQGFDYYSGHFYYRDAGPFEFIALGDYQLNLGQGLIMWSGFSQRKSSYVLNVKKEGRILKPYTSVNEARFMRGGATTVEAGNLHVTAFISHKRIDGNVTEIDSSTEEATAVSSFQESGFHRTENEIADKRAVKQTIAGGNITFKKRKWKIAASAMHTRFDATFDRNLDTYSQFEFSEKQLTQGSLDYSLVLRNFHFFGETAMSDNGAIATVNGGLISLDPKVDLSFVQRYYQKDYQSLYANAFAESTRPTNERGIFVGLTMKPLKKWKIDTYFDFYQHDWLRFRTDAPSSGIDLLAQLTFKPSRKLETYIRYKNEVKSQNAPDDEAVIDYLEETNKGYTRFHLAYKINDIVTIKNRVEVSFYDDNVEEKEFGYLIYQDLQIKPKNFPLQFTGRISLFDTPSFNSRVYTYENNVLYMFSVPSFSGRGMRLYLVTRYKVVRGVDVWVRLAQTYFPGAIATSNGNDLIIGEKATTLTAQVRFKF